MRGKGKLKPPAANAIATTGAISTAAASAEPAAAIKVSENEPVLVASVLI